METKKRYTIGAKLFLFVLAYCFLMLTSALWNTVSAATSPITREHHFKCDGTLLTISVQDGGPLTALIGSASEPWIEIPVNDGITPDKVYFFGIDSSNIAVFELGYVGGVSQYLLHIYADKNAYDKRHAIRDLRCERK